MTGRDRLVVLGAPVGLAALAVVPPIDRGWTLCPIALLTGTACPGCGMTRAVSHLLHGDLAGAIDLHPLVVPVLMIAGVAWVWFSLRRLGRASAMPSRLVNAGLAALAAALITAWVARMASGTLPPV